MRAMESEAMASIPRKASILRGSGVTEGRACEFRSQRSARTKSIDAVESSGARPQLDERERGQTKERVTGTVAETRLPEVASRFQPGMVEINHERSGTLALLIV